MAIDIWGDKPKSQVDPTTVDEEIQSFIDSHVADPDAHLEAGQSLQSHKAMEILDHVVGSVLADKMTMTEIAGSIVFESLDGWQQTGTIYTDVFPGVDLHIEYPTILESKLNSQPQVPYEFLNDTKDILCQAMIRYETSNTHFHSWFGFLTGYLSSDSFFGFQVRDGDLYAHHDDGTNSYNLLIEGIDLTADNIFRVQYNAFTKTISWYINGALVASYVLQTSVGWNTDQGPAFGIKLTQSNDGEMFVGILNFSRQI